jgi:hypothetical protein
MVAMTASPTVVAGMRVRNLAGHSLSTPENRRGR